MPHIHSKYLHTFLISTLYGGSFLAVKSNGIWSAKTDFKKLCQRIRGGDGPSKPV